MDGRTQRDARVVHEDTDLAELSPGMCDELVAVALSSQVSLECAHPGIGAHDGGEVFGSAGVTVIVEHQAVSCCGERHGHLPPQTATASGDDDHFVHDGASSGAPFDCGPVLYAPAPLRHHILEASGLCH